jgi:hypothetical protein
MREGVLAGCRALLYQAECDIQELQLPITPIRLADAYWSTTLPRKAGPAPLCWSTKAPAIPALGDNSP